MNRKIMIVNAVLIFLLFMCISSVSFAKEYKTKTGQSFLSKTSDLGNPSRTLAIVADQENYPQPTIATPVRPGKALPAGRSIRKDGMCLQ